MLDEPANLTPAPGDGPAEWTNYYRIPAGIGAGCVVVAAVLGLAVADVIGKPNATLTVIRAVLCIGGLVAMGVAIWLRPRAVPLLALACATCLTAYFGFAPDWDSGRMVAGFLTIITGIGTVLMALPPLYRRVGISLLLLFHFGNLLAHVTGTPTGNNPPPWLSQIATAHIYRSYSQFMYLQNAYHFYSPDPGPACQVWFCLTYDDGEEIKDAKGKPTGARKEGSKRWFKLPRRPEDMRDPLALSYYRRLSLTQQLERYDPFQSIPGEVERRRDQKAYGSEPIYWHPQLSHADQYRPAQESVRVLLIPSFVRHVANLPFLQHDLIDPATGKPYAVAKIKVYRVEHRILSPLQTTMAEPYSPNTYLPYYQGEYYADGRQTDPYDPLLFWLVPIFYAPKDPVGSRFDNPKTHPENFELYDGLKVHTHSDHDLK